MPSWREFKQQAKEAKIYFAITLSAIVLICVLGGFLGHYYKLAQGPEFELCHTKECITAAHHILSFIDQKVNPCDNFYQFLCGNYMANLTYDSSGLSTSRQFNFENVKHQMLIEHVDDERNLSKSFRDKRKFYRKCLNVSEIERDHDQTFLNDLKYVMGGWPLTDEQLRNVVIDFRDVMLRAREKGMKHDFFFNIDVYRHEAENTMYIEIGTPSQDYMGGAIYWAIFNRGNINTILALAKYWNGATGKLIYRDVEKVIAFATNLWDRVIQSNTQVVNEGPIIQLTPISNINRHVGKFFEKDWLEFLKNFTKIDSLQSTDLVVLNFTSSYYYFREMVNLINQGPREVWLNFVALNLIYDECAFLSHTARHYCMTTMPDPVNLNDRRAVCSDEIRRFDEYEHSIDVEYVRRMNNPQVNAHVWMLFNSVRKALMDSLETALRPSPKHQYFPEVYNYFQGIHAALGWSELVFNETEYDKYYTFKQVDLGNQVLDMRHKFQKTIWDYKFRSLKSEFHVWDPTLNVPTVDFNAFYAHWEKAIFIQTPLLLEPMFGIDRPQCLNYGTLGQIIGHEFMHAFEAAAMTLPKDWKETENKTWLTEMLRVRIDEEKCVLEAFYDRRANVSGISELDEHEKHVDEMISEIIADIGALHFAFYAYEEYLQNHKDKMLPGLKYTPRQLFWIMSGIHMCERRTFENSITRYPVMKYYSKRRFQGQSFRVNAPRMNNPNFVQDFQCERGDNMYTTKTCDLLI